MDKNNLHSTTELIIRDFEIEADEQPMTEEALLQMLADQIAYMIEYRTDFLMSLMYRLDVLEVNINRALHPANPDPANIALAKLVLERQKQRIFTKQKYRQHPIDDMDDMEF